MKKSVLFLVLGAGYAWANGGPVAWSGGSARGDLRPRQAGHIELREENLQLTVDPEGTTYRVRAIYRLFNPRAPEALEYGVPIGWKDVDGESAATAAKKDKRTEGKKAAASVRITLGEGRHGCHFHPADSPGEIGWCVTSLKIPTGESTLKLEYVAELAFTDSEYSSSARTQFSPRVLDYPLFPAGYWKGNPAQVQIEIDPGPFAAPPPPGFTGGPPWKAVWKEVDLKEKKSLHIKFPARRFESAQYASWNARPAGKIEYQADSGLNKLFDGNLGTAWCAKRPASFELRKRTQGSLGTYCRFEGLTVTPGHVGSDALYEKNARVRRLRVSACGGEPRAKMEFEFPSLQMREEASEFLEIPYGHPLAEHYGCLKVEVLATVPDDAGEACLSEVAGVVNCG